MDIRLFEVGNGLYWVYIDGKHVMHPMPKTEADAVMEHLKRIDASKTPEVPRR